MSATRLFRRPIVCLVLGVVAVATLTAEGGDNLVQDPGFDMGPTEWGTSPEWQPWWLINTNKPTWGYTDYHPFSPPYSQAWSGEPEWTQGGIYQDVYVPEAGLYEMVLMWGDHLQKIDGLGPPGPTELRWGIQPGLLTTHDPGEPMEILPPPEDDIIWFGGSKTFWAIVSEWGLVGLTQNISLEPGWVRFWVQTRSRGGPEDYTRAFVDEAYLAKMNLAVPLDPPEGWGPWEYVGTDPATGAESYIAAPEPSAIVLLVFAGPLLLAMARHR